MFHIHPYKVSKPFLMIHSNIWGPLKVTNLNEPKRFITFINDHSNVCWVYLLKEKSEAKIIFENVFFMIQNQFQTTTKICRSNNGQEYFNTILGNFFNENGIVHESSYVNTPEQNGITERKIDIFLKVARSLCSP